MNKCVKCGHDEEEHPIYDEWELVICEKFVPQKGCIKCGKIINGFENCDDLCPKCLEEVNICGCKCHQDVPKVSVPQKHNQNHSPSEKYPTEMHAGEDTEDTKNKEETLSERIIKEWLIEEKISPSGRMDMPLRKLGYGELIRLVLLTRQKCFQEQQEDVREAVKKLKDFIIRNGFKIQSYQDWTAVDLREVIKEIDKIFGDFKEVEK